MSAFINHPTVANEESHKMIALFYPTNGSWGFRWHHRYGAGFGIGDAKSSDDQVIFNS